MGSVFRSDRKLWTKKYIENIQIYMQGERFDFFAVFFIKLNRLLYHDVSYNALKVRESCETLGRERLMMTAIDICCLRCHMAVDTLLLTLRFRVPYLARLLFRAQ